MIAMDNRNAFIAMSAVIVLLGIGGVALTWFVLDSMDEDESPVYKIEGVYVGISSKGTATARDLSDIDHDRILRFRYDLTMSDGSTASFQSTLGIFDSGDRPDPLINVHVGDVELDGVLYDGWTSESDGFTFTYCFGEGPSVRAILIDSEDTHLVARLVSSG